MTKWIKCTDQMPPEPKDYATYLVYIPNAGSLGICISSYLEGEFILDHVTHWMPLPEKPIEQGKI